MALQRKHLALGTLVVPILFLIRNVGRWSALQEESAKSDERFAAHVEELNAAESEGKTFGAGTDEEGCVKETLARTAAEPEFAQSSTGASFVRGCLAGCRVTPGYCATVPAYEQSSSPPGTVEAASAWRKSLCVGIPGANWMCAAQFKFVQLHCHPLQ